MIIIRLMGGLGNQLQQYALYEKLKSLGRDVRIDDSWFDVQGTGENVLAPRKLELRYFPQADYRKASPEEIQALIGTDAFRDKLLRKLRPALSKRFSESGMYHPDILTMEEGYLEGYFAAEKYYADILPLLREKLLFPEPNEENVRAADEIQSKPYPVSVHIRRGDYLDAANASMFGGICTDAYYEGAIKQVEKEHPDAVFFLFSDDPDYCRGHYVGDKFRVMDVNHGEHSFFDIWLMSKCKAHICANSTFSFWGARLDPKENKCMIRPYIHKTTQVFRAEEMHDLWPGWILIDAQGALR